MFASADCCAHVAHREREVGTREKRPSRLRLRCGRFRARQRVALARLPGSVNAHEPGHRAARARGRARQRPACSPPLGRPAATGLGQLALATDASMLALAVPSAEVWAHAAATGTAWGWAAVLLCTHAPCPQPEAPPPPTPSPPRDRHPGRGTSWRPRSRPRRRSPSSCWLATRTISPLRLCGSPSLRRRLVGAGRVTLTLRERRDAPFGLVRVPRLDRRRRAGRPASGEAPRRLSGVRT